MDILSKVLEEAMKEYASKGLNGHSYFMKNEEEQMMSVVAIFTVHDVKYVDVSIMARVVGNHIVVEDDKTNKPLVDALVQLGVPREQIILAYAGEQVPEMQEQSA